MMDLWESWRVCAAVGKAFEGCGGEGERIRARLLELLQAVPVESAEKAVRCCECRHLGFKDFYGVCTLPDGLPGKVQPGDFCSYAERDEPSGMAEREDGGDKGHLIRPFGAPSPRGEGLDGERERRDRRLADAGFEI